MEKWIEDYVDRESPVPRKRVQDAEAVIMQKQEYMGNVGNGQLTTTITDIIFQEIFHAIGDSMSDLAISEDEEDGEDEDDDKDDTELGKLSEDDTTGWVMNTITKTVQHPNTESLR